MDDSDKYNIQMDNKYGYLNLIDIPQEIADHAPWFNQTLTTVNNAVVRLGIFEGDFHWHKHDEQDEMFLVLEGTLFLDVENKGTIALEQHQGYTVPKGVKHRPRSPQKSVVLMIEQVGVVPTGD